jgi:hypothetical protein
MKPYVLLDKSYLQGASTQAMRRLAQDHQLLMSDALFYELISNPASRSRCFAKFAPGENPCELTMHVGGHLKQEIETSQPSGRPSLNLEPIRFEFNSRLLSADYALPAEAVEALREQHAELQTDIQSLIERSRTMPAIFPNVFSGSDQNRRSALAEAEREITTDATAVVEFYSQLRSPSRQLSLPDPRLLSPDWALYRWVQVKLLFALDLAMRYGSQIRQPMSKRTMEKLEHDVLDSEYMLLGVLEGAFATEEKKLKRWFKALSPYGTLHTLGG